MTSESRYDGKPFVRLLDCYVLRAIGHLDEPQAAALKAMEPKLGAVYGSTGTWFEIVAQQMAFPPELDDQMRAIWATGCEKARRMGFEPDPGEFTAQFVDTNFNPA